MHTVKQEELSLLLLLLLLRTERMATQTLKRQGLSPSQLWMLVY